MPGDKINFRVDIALPEGYKLNELLPVTYKVVSLVKQRLVSEEELQGQKQEAVTQGTTAQFGIPTTMKTGEAVFQIRLTYGYCRDGNGGVCKIGTADWKVPVSLKEGAKGKSVNLKITAK